MTEKNIGAGKPTTEKRSVLTPEGREKIVAAQKGRKRSPEHRKKMSDAMLAFWKRQRNEH